MIIFVALSVLFLISTSSVYAGSDLVINEFLPKQSEGIPEWVEFYNSGTSVIDLSDYFFDDDTDFNSDSGSSGKVAISGLLNPQATCYWELTTYLNNNGDTPTLFKTDGSSIDSYQYTQTETDKSYSRVPDGGEWQINQIPTKSSTRCLDLVPSPTPSSTPTPSLTPTIIPTYTPSNTPSPSNTPKPQSSPTNKPSVTPVKISPTITTELTPGLVKDQDSDNIPMVLGESVSTPAAVPEIKNSLYLPLMLFLIGGGLIFISIAIFIAYKQRDLRKNLLKSPKP